MPTTYAHDLFGKQVYKRLPAEMRDLIKKNGQLYRIGLHGPDILFYYHIWPNKINQYGVSMHKKPARSFFEEGLKQVRKEKDPALLAYLLGFACHFTLDCTCHPYINSIGASISHTKIEKELDRFLMLREGRDPFCYYPSDGVVPSIRNAKVIHKALKEISYPTIKIALCYMKRLTNLMVYDDHGRKQKFFFRIMNLAGHKELGEHFMEKEMNPVCIPFLEKIDSLYRESLEKAVEILEELWEISGQERELSSYFDYDYNGNLHF